MVIKVRIKSVYGKRKIYPACEISQLFCNLTNTKTITKDSLKIIRQLGYEVEVKQTVLDVLALEVIH